MARVGGQVTGAVHVFTKMKAAGTRYLGTGKTAPRYRTRYGWVPFFNDLGGPVISFDEVFAGKEAMISLDLNRFDQDTLDLVESVPVPGLDGPGFVDPYSMGTMMVQEEAAYGLILSFPNSSKPAYRAAKLPAGIYFPAAWLEGPSDHTVGNVPREINLVWKAKAVYDPKEGDFLLATRTLPAFPKVS